MLKGGGETTVNRCPRRGICSKNLVLVLILVLVVLDNSGLLLSLLDVAVAAG